MSQRKESDVCRVAEGAGRVSRGASVAVQRAGHATAVVQRAWHAPLELSSQHVIKVAPKDGLTIHELDPVLLACVPLAIRRQLLDLLLHVLSAGAGTDAGGHGRVEVGLWGGRGERGG